MCTTAFSPTSTADDLLKSKCSSCGVVQDKSAYWAPPLYFQGDDGTLTIVPEKPPFLVYVEDSSCFLQSQHLIDLALTVPTVTTSSMRAKRLMEKTRRLRPSPMASR